MSVGVLSRVMVAVLYRTGTGFKIGIDILLVAVCVQVLLQYRDGQKVLKRRYN